MSKLFKLILLTGLVYLFGIQSALAELPKNNAIPGGIAVVPLGSDFTDAPVVTFGNQTVAVSLHNSIWMAIVGIPGNIVPGKFILKINSADSPETLARFTVKPVSPEQNSQRTITLPGELDDVEFSTIANNDEMLLSNLGDEPEAMLEPVFNFHQVVDNGNYIPYGQLIKRNNPVGQIEHRAVTYLTKVDTLIRCPAKSVVERIFLTNNSGITVVLNHGKGLRSIVSNLSETSLKLGDILNPGDKLGTTKSVESLSMGRMDWQLILNGAFIDPLQFSPAS